MPYTDDGSAWRDDRTREARKLNDPFVVAAEQLAANVETYLYDADSDGYRNEDFLGFCLSLYDATKRSSGNYVDQLTWSPEADEDALHTVVMSDTHTTGDRKDDRLGFSEAEHIRRGKDNPDYENPESYDDPEDPAAPTKVVQPFDLEKLDDDGAPVKKGGK
jgi:hypothetical protein